MDAEAEEKFYRHLQQVKKGKIVLLVHHHTDMSECAVSLMQTDVEREYKFGKGAAKFSG